MVIIQFYQLKYLFNLSNLSHHSLAFIKFSLIFVNFFSYFP